MAREEQLALQAEGLINKIPPAPPSTPFSALFHREDFCSHVQYINTHFSNSRDAAWPGPGIFGRNVACASKNWLQSEHSAAQ